MSDLLHVRPVKECEVTLMPDDWAENQMFDSAFRKQGKPIIDKFLAGLITLDEMMGELQVMQVNVGIDVRMGVDHGQYDGFISGD